LDFDKIALSFKINQGVGDFFVQAPADKLRVPVEGTSDKRGERQA
jgi:hypothetical protein